jgi:hypothetical protein
MPAARRKYRRVPLAGPEVELLGTLSADDPIPSFRDLNSRETVCLSDVARAAMSHVVHDKQRQPT